MVLRLSFLVPWSLVTLSFSQRTDVVAVHGTSNAFIAQNNDIANPRFHDIEENTRLSNRNGGGEVGEVVSTLIAEHD